MTFQSRAGDGLDYEPCYYGQSRIVFRGPARDLDKDYVAFLGGNETFGRFIRTPFPEIVDADIHPSCVNFGVPNAGLDLYLNDPSVLKLASRAELTVLQVLGAQNLSNRYYQVHPRRNDRFLRASDRLKALFPEVDFTEFHFTKHMLGRLYEISPVRGDTVVAELQSAWIARMRYMLSIIGGPVFLFWFADHRPSNGVAYDLRQEPLFVTQEMIDALRPYVAARIETVCAVDRARDAIEGVIQNESTACAAAHLLGPLAHESAARDLSMAIKPFLRKSAA